jgi:small subunit ribosomal protein S4
MQEDLERTKKFGSAKVCLGSSFAEHNRMKNEFVSFKILLLIENTEGEKPKSSYSNNKSFCLH